MGNLEKQGFAEQRKKTTASSYSPENITSLRNDTLGASRAFISHKIEEKRSYLRAAFANPYNLSLFAGALAAAGLTLNPLLGIVALGAEALWLLFAPDSKVLRRKIWDPQFDKEQSQQLEQMRAQLLSNLNDSDRSRVEGLIERHQQINQLAAQNPSFTGEMMRSEVSKTDRLVQAFIDMTLTCDRYEDYLRSIDLNEMDRERRRWEAISKGKGGHNEFQGREAELRIAAKNLAVIMRRFDKINEIRQYLTLARGQLSLIENSFKLISDQIVTMQSPRELTGQLDELLDGVESIKQTAIETEGLMESRNL